MQNKIKKFNKIYKKGMRVRFAIRYFINDSPRVIESDWFTGNNK